MRRCVFIGKVNLPLISLHFDGSLGFSVCCIATRKGVHHHSESQGFKKHGDFEPGAVCPRFLFSLLMTL